MSDLPALAAFSLKFGLHMSLATLVLVVIVVGLVMFFLLALGELLCYD